MVTSFVRSLSACLKGVQMDHHLQSSDAQPAADRHLKEEWAVDIIITLVVAKDRTNPYMTPVEIARALSRQMWKTPRGTSLFAEICLPGLVEPEL